MAGFGTLLGWSLVVGGALLAGALAAVLVDLPPRAAAVLTSAGGGLLLAAVAFELAPEADARAGSAATAGGILAGMLVYVAADAWLAREEAAAAMRRAAHAAKAGRPTPVTPDAARGESIAVGLFVDGVPESLALGLTIAEGELGLALLVGVVVGNLVEAYGAAQPIAVGGRTRGFAVGLLGTIGLALALATVVGGTFLADRSSVLVGTAEAVAAGAVLAVISISIIPHAFAQVSGVAACATVCGFVAGYLLS